MGEPGSERARAGGRKMRVGMDSWKNGRNQCHAGRFMHLRDARRRMVMNFARLIPLLCDGLSKEYILQEKIDMSHETARLSYHTYLESK